MTGYSYNAPDFPATPDAFDPIPDGFYNAFFTVFARDGTALSYSTMLGAAFQVNVAFDLALDPEGGAYVVGSTDARDFPTTPGPSTARSMVPDS